MRERQSAALHLRGVLVNDLISALRHTLYKTHDKSDGCSGCVHAEAVLVEADRDPKALLPAELMAVVEAARLSVDNCGCGLPKPADVEALKFYIVEDEAGASEMCMSCLAILRALIAWDAVLDGSSGAPGNPASVSTLSSFSTTGAEEPSGTTGGGTDECGVEGHAGIAGVAQATSGPNQPEGVPLSFSERKGAGIEPGHSSVAPPANTVPPVADPGPAESQPARDPASDVHAGGGEPALGTCIGFQRPHYRLSVCQDWTPSVGLLDQLATWVGVKK